MISSVPAEIISLSNGADGGQLGSLKIVRIVKLAKLLRLLRMGKLIENVAMLLPELGAVIGLLRLLFMMTVVAHINACIFYFIATLNMGNSWVSKLYAGAECCDNNNEDFIPHILADESTVWKSCVYEASMVPLSRVYNTAIYWSFTTLATVGYGDVTPCNHMEIVYTTGAMVVGSAMFAYIVGDIASIVSTRQGQELKMQASRHLYKCYMYIYYIYV